VGWVWTCVLLSQSSKQLGLQACTIPSITSLLIQPEVMGIQTLPLRGRSVKVMHLKDERFYFVTFGKHN
jgi:hypothetical protein